MNDKNPILKNFSEKCEFAWDHYTGEYIDKDKIHNYLYQRMQREGKKAFESRIKDPDPILHFPTVVDSINGIVFSKAKDTVREWGGLGDPEEEKSTAYALTRNADGEGTNWGPVFKEVGIKLTVLHKLWGLVEGIQKDENGRVTSQASVKLIMPQSIEDVYPETGNPQQVLVKESRVVRSSINEESEPQEVFTLFELNGWTRYTESSEKNQSGEDVRVKKILNSGEYEYWESSKKEMRVLPIFRVRLPLPRHLGYMLAKKQNHIFNYKSLRDHGASNLSLAMFKIKANSLEEHDEIANGMQKGNNTIWEHAEITGPGHTFMSPDSSYLSEAGSILDTDVEHFYQNAFREFGDVARQATATEILQKSSTGIEAFLALLVSAIDEFENQCFHRIEQVYALSSWGEAKVQRSTDFQPEDIEEAMERMKKRFFGDNPVPITNPLKVELIKKLLERDGVSVEDEEGLIELIDRSVDANLVQALARIEGKGMSTEEMVRVLRPGWDETKINAEVKRINVQHGATIPDPFIGG